MAESPGGTRSIGRSRGLFDCLFLPLLSFWSIPQKGDVVNDETVQSAPIAEQPKEPYLNQLGTDAEEPSCVSDSQVSMTSSLRSTSTDNFSIGSDPVTPVRGCSIDNYGSPSADRLNIIDLPLLALLTICGHLRPDDGSNIPCKDIFNFRNTCRPFAHAVNTFFENSANLPTIQRVTISIEEEVAWTDATEWLRTVEWDNPQPSSSSGIKSIQLSARLLLANFVLHPLSATRSPFHWPGDTSVTLRFDVGSDQAIKLSAQSLLGPVETLLVDLRNAVSDMEEVLKIARNLQFKSLRWTTDNLTNEMGSLILALVRDQSNIEVTISFNTTNMTDAPALLDQLYSSTSAMTLEQLTEELNPYYFMGKSTGFWLRWFEQKRQTGWKIESNVGENAGRTNLILVSGRSQTISWRK